jgi:DNA-binding transcriptional LysR family regulator
LSIDIDHLKTFLEVYRTRHFGKAADQLYVTQSTVSARIRLLEDIIGAPLFLRRRNDIQLTGAGKRLLRYAESIVTTWNRARQEIAIEEETRIPLTVAGVPSIWDITLQDWLHSIWSGSRELALQMEVLPADSVTRRLVDGTLDLAFVFEAPQLTELQIHEIARIPLIMVSSQSGRNVAEALGSNYILVDWGTHFAIEHARHFPEMSAPLLRMGLGRMARDFILACGGSAYLAEPMVAELIDNGGLYRVADAPVIERSAHAIYPRNSQKIEQIQAVLEYYA